MSAGLDELCLRHGVARAYRDMAGETKLVPDATKRAVLQALGVDPDAGLSLGRAPRPADDESAASLPARAPARCFVPGFLSRGRVWGIALQLYQLRSGRSLGIGDFRDLRDAVVAAGRAGADFVGVNPLHALYTADPERCSPFSPSNRRFLNPLYIAVDEAPGFAPGDVTAETRARLGALPLVDYAAVAAAKLPALEAAWRRWRASAGDDGEPRAFRAFVADRGEPLLRHATFEALSADFASRGLGAGWRSWPAEYHDPAGEAVRRFAGRNAEAVELHTYLQWVADRQLAAVADAGRAAGLRIGLYLDLAIGDAPDGSASWSDRRLVLDDLRIGAPPDMFNEVGQDWGLAPLSPVVLAERGYEPLHAMLADVLCHAGGLRLDHVMGLLRMYCIPEGMSPREGTYLRYSVGEAIEAVARASVGRGAVVVGEDLGTVPDGLRDLLADAEIHSYRVLYFERAGGRLAPPGRYPARALACLSTHDLATLEGWWRGGDIGLRLEKGIIAGDAAARERAGRRCDIEGLVGDLVAAGRLAPRPAREPLPELDDELAAAVHRHVAASPSRLFAIRLEDLAGERDPVNVPGTAAGSYPNWRRRLALPIDRLEQASRYSAIVDAVAAERPRR